MSRQFKPCVTPEEYLALERKADYRSDYLHGEIFAMTGAGGGKFNRRECRPPINRLLASSWRNLR